MRAGGIAPIVMLLEVPHPSAHQFASGALARLAVNNADNQVQIAKKLRSLLAPGVSDGAQQRAAELYPVPAFEAPARPWQLAGMSWPAPGHFGIG